MNVSTSVNNFLPFSINNVERMRVDTTGNVGILRSDPAYPLDISGITRISNVGNVDGTLLLGSAGLSYTNATNNISLGKTTANTTVGSGNVAVGNSTMSSLTTGTNNVALGYIAGNTITSGSQNVYVGGNTVPSAAAATNEIAVGFGATGLGSNTVVLGNSSIATTALRGNVGIGTTAPAAVLDVNGATKIRGTLDLSTNNITNANQISATTNLVLQPTTGNVGIGTTTPSMALDVNGEVRVSTNYTVDGTLYLGSAAVAYQNSTKNVVFGSGSLPPASGSNNVAIGNGTLAALTTGTNNTTLGLNAGTTITTGTGNVYVGAGAAASAVGVSNEIVIGSGTTGLGSNSAVLGNSNIATTILRGNVGIGTTAPEATLQINKTGTNKGLVIDSGNQNVVALELSGNSVGWGSGILLNNTTTTTGRKYGIYSNYVGTLTISDESTSIHRMQITKDGTLLMSSNTVVNPIRSSQLSIGCRVAGLLTIDVTSHELVLDLVSVRWFTTGSSRCLQIKTVGSNFTMLHFFWYHWGAGGSFGAATGSMVSTVTTTYQNFVNAAFAHEGDQPNHIIWDTTNNRCYRLMGIVNSSFVNNITILERMYP